MTASSTPSNERDRLLMSRLLDPLLHLRHRMSEQNISIETVAERLSLPSAALSAMLQGDQDISLKTLFLVSDAINVALTVQVGTIPSLNASTGKAHKTPLSAVTKAVASHTSVPSPTNWFETIASTSDVIMLDKWLKGQRDCPTAMDAFQRSIDHGWVDGMQRLWSSGWLKNYEALVSAWQGSSLKAEPLPLASRAFLEKITWVPGAGLPLKDTSLVWSAALNRVWDEHRFDDWHDALARCTVFSPKAHARLPVLWMRLYASTDVPHHERARSMQALFDRGLPLSSEVVIQAYVDQSPLLDLFMAQSSPGLTPKQASLLLCQAGLVNHLYDIPKEQRERFEDQSLVWGALPYVDVNNEDLHEFSISGRIFIPKPTNEKTKNNVKTISQHLTPYTPLKGSKNDSSSVFTENSRVFVGDHWPLSVDVSKPAEREASRNDFEKKFLNATLQRDRGGVDLPLVSNVRRRL